MIIYDKINWRFFLNLVGMEPKALVVTQHALDKRKGIL